MATKKEKQTYRCRLYLLPFKRLHNQVLCTELWDFKEMPFPIDSLLKKSELLNTFTGRTVSDVRKKLDPYRLKHGYILSGDHLSAGTI